MKNLTKRLQQQFNNMCATGKLFRTNMSGERIWEAYLMGFPETMDPTFRDLSSSVHNCNHCNNFIRRYGNIVAIGNDYKLISIFDVVLDEVTAREYGPSMERMATLIKSREVVNIFKETFLELNSLPYSSVKRSDTEFQLGVDRNIKTYTKAEAMMYPNVVEEKEVKIFDHFYLQLPATFVDLTTKKSIESIMADYRTDKEVFLRAMNEISLDTYELVIDLINQGSLRDAEAHLHKLKYMKLHKETFDNLPMGAHDNYAWIASYELNIAKFRNELIGVLCSDIAQGVELNTACLAWNKRVDPKNYMKAVAPITTRQREEAEAFVIANGYAESFARRHAVLGDISAAEINHINTGDDTIAVAALFGNVPVKSSRHRKSEFDGVEEITIDNFMENILPKCTGVQLYLDNKLANNMVNLTAPVKDNVKNILGWSNPYSYTYAGNLAGKSSIKEAVKSQGGGVDGVLRFSIMWSENDSTDDSDLDAHCQTPDRLIHYANRNSSGGVLDIDIRRPSTHKRDGAKVVENITFKTIAAMSEGLYQFRIHQFSEHSSQGFKAELELNGQTFNYSFEGRVTGCPAIVDVRLKNGQLEVVKHHMEYGETSRKIYDLDSNNFHKVNLICPSPNHWGENAFGNKHYFFMLDKCKTDVSIRGFHSENLNSELKGERKVLEVVGAVNQIAPEGKQLAGVGFNATLRDEVILKLDGSFKRVVKVKF